ncbi:ESPL1 [Symbiodinium sp. CCMP2456]|nr:ESPL1 [Symbiodinium sp. CCMP2456]
MEQLQLLQSVTQLARRGRISPSVAEPITRVIQLLMQLVPPLWCHLSLPDKEAASRVLASALEALTLCLPPSPEQSISSLDWADAFMEQLTGSAGELNRGDTSLPSLQMLFSVVLRARLQQSEEFRKADPQLLMMQRSDLFALVLHGQSLQEFTELSGDASLVAAASPGIPKSDHCSTWLRLAGLEGTAAQTLPGFCRYSVQAVEALRLQLPRGLAAALLCLRQLRLHHAVLAKDREPVTKAQEGWHLAHCASFARLTVAQSSEPDFAAALSKSGASRRIPALAVVVQLERCIQSQGEEAETLLEVGRLRLLQAQASQQGAITDDQGDHEEPRRFVALALLAWQRALAVDSGVLAARTPAGVADALQAVTATSFAGGSHAVLLLRDASDAAHLLEGMDLDHLAFRALVLCLACLHRRHGSAALWWRPEAMEVSEKVHSCMQASVVLLYRMAGAMGRLASTPKADAEARAAALGWWQLAEAELKDLQVFSQLLESEYRMGRAAVACVAREEGPLGTGLLHNALAGNRLGANTNELRTAVANVLGAVLSRRSVLGPEVCESSRTRKTRQRNVRTSWCLKFEGALAALARFPVCALASHLYKWLGEADLADACCQCGLQLISQRLCGDHRWKLRFLCMRARSAMAQSNRLPDMAGFKEVKVPELERLLAEIDTLWNGMQVSAKMGAEEYPKCQPSKTQELWAEAGTMDGSSWRGFPEFGRSWKLRLTALAAQRRRCPEAWAAHIDGLLSWMRTMPDKPLPQLGQMLLTVAQVFFDEAVEGGHNSIDAGACDELLAVLSSCKRELVRSESCPLLQPHQEEAVVAAAKAGAVPERRALFMDAHVGLPAVSRASVKDGSSSSAKLVAVFYLVAGAFRDALVAGDSMTLRASAQLLLRAAEASKSKAAAVQKDEKVPSRGNCRSRSRSPRRDMPGGVLSSSWTREYWSLCKQVVPLCSAVSLLFLTELRSMQRVVESLGDARMMQYFFSEPHKELQPSVAVAKLSSGEWLKEVRADLSLAWLQVDWQGPLLRITRSLDSGLGPASHSQLVSQQVLLPHGLLPCLQEELRSLHALNGQKIRELWQRDDKGTEAVRREFWNSRKRFDAELGRVAEKVEQEILGPWRFLLAPWPQTDRAQQTLLAHLDAWVEEATSASHRTLRSAQDGQQPSLRPEDAQQRFLLALLFLEADKLEAGEIATVLEAFWPGNSSQLRRRASSLKRYRSDCRAVLGAAEISQEEAPLILYVDATVAQLPLEACACLRHRKVVRGLAPNMTLKALAGAGEVKPRTGYFIIDPAEDCSNMGDVRQLLARWSSHGQAWHGHTGQPMPASKEVLEELCCNDVFIYLGHGERARQLLRQDELQLAGSTKGASQASLASQATSEESSQESLEEPPGSESAKRGLRSILMLLGCSSVRLQRPSAQGRRGDFESFGLASSALLGGAPLVLGAQWDILGGDLDRLASRLLQDWLKGVSEEGQAGLLSSLRSLRPRCMLPNLTGAAVVCYGIPM